MRARLFGPDGAVAASAYRTLPVAFPGPGRVEQDPLGLERASEAVLREALCSAGCTAADVAGLGIATQRATALAWDAGTRRPIAPAVGWQDQRRASALDRLNAQGIPLTSQAAVAKFLWWLEHDAPVKEAARRGTLRLGTPDVWLGDRLSGGSVYVTDPGHAGCTALYHPEEGGWAAGFLELLDIDPAWLPTIVASASVAGETAGMEGLAGIPLAARAGDQQAAAFAAGLRRKGQAKLTLGTAAMLDLHVGDAPSPPRPGTIPLPLWRLPDGRESHCLEGSVGTAGAAAEWCVQLGLAADVPALERLARSAPDAGGVVAVPAFQGLGTPFGDDRARGFVGGLTRGSSAAEFARAVFEGIAHRCVDLWEALEPEEPEIRVDGGLSQCNLLLERIAALAGRPVLRAADPEGTARGIAALAALAVAGSAEALLPAAPRERFAPGPEDPGAARERWRSIVRERVAVGEPARPGGSEGAG